MLQSLISTRKIENKLIVSILYTDIVTYVNNEYVGDSFNISGSVIDKNGIDVVRINNESLTIGNGLTEDEANKIKGDLLNYTNGHDFCAALIDYLKKYANTVIEKPTRKINAIKDNKELENCFRLYSNKREEIIIRLDNCIIYSRPSFDVYGRPQLLTNTEFEVFSVKSTKGQDCIIKYETVWENAKKFSDYL